MQMWITIDVNALHLMCVVGEKLAGTGVVVLSELPRGTDAIIPQDFERDADGPSTAGRRGAFECIVSQLNRWPCVQPFTLFNVYSCVTQQRTNATRRTASRRCITSLASLLA